MPISRTKPTRFALNAILAAGLSACSGDINPVRDVLVSAGAGTTRKTAPEFIERSRPQTVDYLPVGGSAPPRPSAAKSKDQVQALESQLDQTRTTHETEAQATRQLGATPAPAPASVPPDLRGTN